MLAEHRTDAFVKHRSWVQIPESAFMHMPQAIGRAACSLTRENVESWF